MQPDFVSMEVRPAVRVSRTTSPYIAFLLNPDSLEKVGEFALEMARWKESNHLEAACASFVVVTRVPVSGRQRASKKRLSRGCTNSLSRCYANYDS
eukprot:s3203_g1.t1